MNKITLGFFTTLQRNYLLPLFLLFFASTFGQNGIIGDGFTNGWSNADIIGFNSSAGTSRIATLQPKAATTTQYFRMVRNWASDYTQFGPFGCVDTDWTNPGLVYGMSVCGSGAFYINCPNTTDNYVFKTPNSTSTVDFLYFKVQGAVRSVSTVTQSPLAASVTQCHATTVTANLDGALATGQAVYLRYTKDGYATSTVVQLAGSGVTYTGKIPSAFNTAGANVSYYLFTSGTATPSGANADLYTINLNNNGGSNYSYTVAAGGTTTSIPDPYFEQALIDLGLDCGIDGLVYTNNINNVIDLDVSSKSISNLTGIEAFTSLQSLICRFNSISSLNVNGLTNLYYLLCDNNSLTSLDVSALTNLQTLGMMANSITTLDVSNSPNLTYLDCDDNAFTSINVSGLKYLNEFYCNTNNLSDLSVRGLTSLVNFECTGNPSLTCILVDDVAAANTASITIDPTQSPNTFWDKDLSANYSYCACGLTTTWNGSLWSNGAPTSTYAAIIAGNYSESTNIDACTLTINNDAIVTIPSGFNVTLNAPITVVSGSSFTLSNNANLIQTNKKSVNSGNIFVNRSSNALYRLDYIMWSSPVTSQNLLAFSPLTSVTPNSRFYTYDNTLGTSGLYTAVASPSTTNFSTGTGYLIRMPNEDPSNLGGGSPYALGSAAITYNGVFTGVPNNGDVTLTVTSGTYNAIGNPYPSTISAESFLSGNSTDGILYFWRKTNAASGTAYATYTAGGATTTTPTSAAPNGTIQVGQGFIVKTGVAATTLNFTNAMRTANNANQIFKTRNIVERNRVWLNLTNTIGVFSQALVGYMTNATQGVDAGIDGKYINDSPIALTSNINNEEYTIQGRALPFDASDVVALNFKTDVAGDFTIAIDHVDGLFSGSQDVFLKDNTTGTETDLKAEAYTFTAAAGVDNARFSLKYQKTLKVDVPVFNDNSVTVYKNKGTLYVNSGAMAIANIKVFDIQGRLIAEQKNVKANTATIKDLKATRQVLIVKITAQDNTVVSKKVLN